MENKTSKYFKYAIGEIVLVVIGILIALQINKWNEYRKSQLTKIEIYNNLIHSLRQDSLEIERIIYLQKKSIDAHIKFMATDLDQFVQASEDNLGSIINDISRGALSFFPRYGIYTSIVTNNQIDLIDSNNIKLSLINLYDYQYKRYENIDVIVDQKFQFQIFPTIDKKLMSYKLDTLTNDKNLIRTVKPNLLKIHFKDLVTDLKDNYRIMNTGFILLLDIQNSINNLINDINRELEK